MLVYKDGVVADYREFFKGTSFPASGISDSFLAENNAVKVSVFLPHDRATEKLVSCDPYVQDGFAYTIQVAPKTEEELTADRESKSAEVRKQRDELLAQSDWRVIKAMEQNGQVESEWAIYRQALRDITDQPEFPDVEFPVSPDNIDINKE
jgi:hypothetical protein